MKLRSSPAAFEKVNTSDGARIDNRDLIAAANRATPVPSAASHPVANDVQATVAAVAVQALSHEPVMEIPKRSHRRRNDYLLVAVPVNLVLGAALYFLRLRDATLFVFLTSALVLVNAALVWLLFVVMDRY